MADYSKKPIEFSIKNAKLDDLQAEVVKSKILESVLTQVKLRPDLDPTAFSFGLSFGLEW